MKIKEEIIMKFPSNDYDIPEPGDIIDKLLHIIVIDVKHEIPFSQ